MKRVMISLVLICLLGLSPLLSVAMAQTAATRAPASQQPADGGWPRAYTTESGATILIYQPQVASWENQRHLAGYAAVSYLPSGAQKPSLGTLKVESDTKVSLEERLVSFKPLKITEANFQSLPKEQTREIITEVEKTIPDEERVIALDRVLAYIDKSQITAKNVEGIKADPPVIFFSKTPAVLVNVDGDPIWSPIKENDLKFAVNTNWDLFQHVPTNAYYLRNEETWLKASDPKGPWTPAVKLPDSFTKLPDEDNWKEVKASLPGKKAQSAPTVFVSFQPAELILLGGVPRYAPVEGTDLLWVSNTESDVFRLNANGPVYYLVTGRWFSAPDFKGPWTFATTSLPEGFKRIPIEHPRSRVLASVPGTAQAAEAILLAQVPQTARVNKKELKAPEVVYQGNPEYKPIEGTSLEHAANTDKDIIKVGDLYYMCFQGVWFMGRSANGPWEVTNSVPGQIYEIPASSASHHVTYVKVEEDDDDDDDWVTFAAVAGYTGMMIAWGCAVWGTGWYYPPYVWRGGLYPVYHPYFPTYGYAAWYNPYTGTYGRSARVYGPYGGAGVTARYNPSTGTYARGAAAYGPYGARGAAQAYNPRTGAYAATRQGAGVYGSWGSTYVQRGDDWASTRRVTNRATGTTTRVTRTDEGGMVSRRGQGGSGFVAKGEENVYAGRDGNVYKKDGSGNWNKYENGGWNQVEKPGSSTKASSTKAKERNREAKSGASPKQMDRSTYDKLERDRSARSEGTQRTRDLSSYKSRGGGNAGSYRSGGGGFGGGGRRSGGGGRRRR